MRKVYNPVGFGKGYNFILWLLFAGALMGFALSRFFYLSYNGVFCSSGPSKVGNHAAPGECWQYSTKDLYKIGIQIHLYTIIPAAFLVCFQFVPLIRYRALLFHRLNGYLVILLSLAGTVGALMIGRIAFGGGIEIQTIVGVNAILFLGSLALAIYNIKRLQIEQHRAWMLRAWFYAGSIITSRLIMFLSALVISSAKAGPYYDAMPCDKIASFYTSNAELLQNYPNCTSPENWAPVRASLNAGSAANAAAALDITFGMALWLALLIHALGIEVYLHLTPAEFERLRNISYQRQLEAGFTNPGRAGLTADRLGDSEKWVPVVAKQQGGSKTANLSDSDEALESRASKAILHGTQEGLESKQPGDLSSAAV